MVDAILKDAIVNNAYFTETVLKVGSIEGADFSDTLLDRFVQKKLCEKATGTQSVGATVGMGAGVCGECLGLLEGRKF